MSRTIRPSVTLLALLLLALPAAAQHVGGRGVRGLVSSASTMVPVQGSATIYTVPQGNHFVLTQTCFSGGGMGLSGQSFGRVVTDFATCTTYVPGVALGPGEILTCDNPNGGDAHCMITGVLTR